MTRIVVIDPTGSLAATTEAVLHRDAAVEVRQVDTLDDAWGQLGHEGVLVAGPTLANRAGVEALQLVHRRAPAVRVVLVFDHRPGASMREVVGIGAEALVDPADATALRAALERAVRLSREFVAVSELSETTEEPGRLVTVVSPTGGCGKTFLATNLATSMAVWAGVKVVLVDLDLQFGEVAASLNVSARRGFGDLVGLSVEDLPGFVDEALSQHPSGIDILAAPADPVIADQIDGDVVGAVIDHLLGTHDVVVVDTSTGLSEQTLAAIDRTDDLVVMSLLDVASIRNLRTLDRTLDRLSIPFEGRRLVLNKDRTGVGLTADEVERALGRNFVARIPYADEVARSTNRGRTVVLDHPSASLLRPLLDIIVAVAPEDRRAELDTHRPPSRRRFALPWRRDGRTPITEHVTDGVA